MLVIDNDRFCYKKYPQTLLEECKYEIKKLKWKILLMMIQT